MKHPSFQSLYFLLLLTTTGNVCAQDQQDPVVAKINNYELRMSDVNAQISKMPLGDQVSVRSDPEKFAESLVQEEVLFQYMLSNGFNEDPELRSELKTIAINHLIDKQVTQKLKVTDEEIQQFYDDNTSSIRGETVEVSHILTEHRDKCEAINEKLQQGGSFSALAQQYSIHQSSALNGGQLGSIMNHNGPLGFEPQLFDIPQNHYTIFESPEGCHIVVVTGRDTPPLPPIEKVEPALRNLLMRQKEIDALQALIGAANQQIKVIRP